MIHHFEKQAGWHRALDFFEAMLKKQVQPDQICYSIAAQNGDAGLRLIYISPDVFQMFIGKCVVWRVTLPPTIMELENGCIRKVTTIGDIGGTHCSVHGLGERG